MVLEIQSKTDKTFCYILDHFLPFYPLSDPEKLYFEKMKTIPGDIILLQMCTINKDRML